MDGEARRACVIGAGTMGSGIAAHLANIGFDVTLLDLTEASAQEAFGRVKTARPPHFYVPSTANAVKLGGLDKLAEVIPNVDWVCEAIIEKMGAKRDLFAQLEPLLRPDTMISTNTSGLEISLLAEGRSESFRRRFLGTHFFNPPRYLKLLELIPTPETDSEVIRKMTEFLEHQVARRVVLAKDTPGFIANRFGMWAMINAIHAAERLHLSVEQVDAITGPFLGRPRSASFRLNDLVGLDIMQDIAKNLFERCPDDPHRENLRTPQSMAALLERGWIGEKVGQGYYRREGKELVVLDFNTMAYREKQDVVLPALDELSRKPLGERIAAALDFKDETGEFLREHLVPVLQYADYLKAEISHSVQDFDRVMRWGFAWEMGPFEMIDAIGPEKLGIKEGKFYQGMDMRAFDGAWVHKRLEPQFRRLDNYTILEEHPGFITRDLGEGVISVGVTTKMGVLSPATIESLIAYLEKEERPFVYTSEARSFSAGFDLQFLLDNSAPDQWPTVEAGLILLQDLGILLSTKRAVAAVFGHCLGGGYEMAMACPVIVAHPESQIGLPEAKVGLLPGGGGTMRMRLMHQHSAKDLVDVAKNLMLGTVSSNADDARRLGYLRDTDVTAYNPDMLITVARQIVLQTEPTPLPEWRPIEGPISGMIDRNQDELKAKGEISDYDETIGDRIKQVLVKATSPESALELERIEFKDLLGHALTHARIRHMLDTGKPLRN
ncbi:MAG: 3-hydroxyacyl-CoA dehydrogenase/enoyl-CoA hydratase family protein [Fimbriimonadaceae bacterium]|nr:3-hydroxyacyl-CoA dehydrogenase/enoyl-CoA hydratase family protein [Fimbriimonadaceae bacterium]